MELWIRSQNRKKLCKVTNLHIKTYTTYSNYGSYEQIAIFNDNIVLGDYKEERALEVLDEIQRAVLCTGLSYEELTYCDEEYTGRFGTNSKSDVAIYEMPEE